MKNLPCNQQERWRPIGVNTARLRIAGDARIRHRHGDRPGLKRVHGRDDGPVDRDAGRGFALDKYLQCRDHAGIAARLASGQRAGEATQIGYMGLKAVSGDIAPPSNAALTSNRTRGGRGSKGLSPNQAWPIYIPLAEAVGRRNT